jgi:hypothetical protein
MLEDVERRFGSRWYGKDGHGLSRSKYIFPIDEVGQTQRSSKFSADNIMHRKNAPAWMCFTRSSSWLGMVRCTHRPLIPQRTYGSLIWAQEQGIGQ